MIDEDKRAQRTTSGAAHGAEPRGDCGEWPARGL